MDNFFFLQKNLLLKYSYYSFQSVDTIILSNFNFFADLIVQYINGLSLNDLVFLNFMDLDPILAGITPKISI